MNRNYKMAAPAVWTIAVIVFIIWSIGGSAQKTFEPGKLDPKHAKPVLKCSACHQAFKGTPDALCIKCHKTVIKERNTIHEKSKKTCDSCHNLHGKDTLGINKGYLHLTNSLFIGKHLSTSCKNCHILKDFKKTPRICYMCHQYSAHKYGVVNECEKCHTSSSWNKFNYKHNKKTDCKICHLAQMGHNSQACFKCHTTKNWQTKFHLDIAKKTCEECHKEKRNLDHFKGAKCDMCHNISTWKSITINHPTIKGHYDFSKIDCKECHPKDYKTSRCTSCHEPGIKPERAIYTGEE